MRNPIFQSVSLQNFIGSAPRHHIGATSIPTNIYTGITQDGFMNQTSAYFDLLADDHRRNILFLLCDTESIQVPDGLLTRSQAQPVDTHSHSSPGSRQQSTKQDLSQLEAQLHHAHLPKLENNGVIEWDQETQTVSRGPNFDELEPVLRLFATNQDRFPNDLL
jgi:hypothetical protein